MPTCRVCSTIRFSPTISIYNFLTRTKNKWQDIQDIIKSYDFDLDVRLLILQSKCEKI